MEISDYLMQWEKRNSRHSHAIRWREIESSGLILEQQDFGAVVFFMTVRKSAGSLFAACC